MLLTISSAGGSVFTGGYEISPSTSSDVNPKPKSRKPKPETWHPKPETRNPKPEILNPKPETLNSESLNPEI